MSIIPMLPHFQEPLYPSLFHVTSNKPNFAQGGQLLSLAVPIPRCASPGNLVRDAGGHLHPQTCPLPLQSVQGFDSPLDLFLGLQVHEGVVMLARLRLRRLMRRDSLTQSNSKSELAVASSRATWGY
jgi:hypothetical protein